MMYIQLNLVKDCKLYIPTFFDGSDYYNVETDMSIEKKMAFMLQTHSAHYNNHR